jgi:hypothetical protein
MSEELPVIETSQGEVIQTAEQAPVLENAEETAKPAEIQADKTFTQAELDAIVQKRITKLERKQERQQIESETRAKVMQEVQTKPDVSSKPKIEDFTDYNDYSEALTDWKVDQKLADIESKKAQESQRQSQQSEAERTSERQRDLIENGERKYDDFEDVVKSDKHTYSRAAYLSILESDMSADIVYHLAKNQDEAKRIADLPAYAQAKEIGKLEDRLSAKEPVKKSSAPKPIDPIGSGSANPKAIEQMSISEYSAMRAKQGARWAR